MKKLFHIEAYSKRRAGATSDDYRELANLYGTPLLLVDCSVIRQQYNSLCQALPGVELFYAIKTLPQRDVLETLKTAGAGFDVASCGEIDLVASCGVTPDRCIHTHPVKKVADIEKSLDFGCNIFVVDNPFELEKFVPYRQEVRLLLRVGFRSRDAVVDLARKYGCRAEDVPQLLEQARSLGITVTGLSFHVGSQTISPDAHVEAVRESAEIIAFCRNAGLARLDLLDIGGGFPAAYSDDIPGIEDFCAPIRAELAKLPGNVRLIAEPGRYIAAPSVTAISSVTGKALRGDAVWYYIDDGVYGSYSGRIYDNATYPIEVPGRSGPPKRSVLAGPTCDSIDVIAEDLMLPELEIGDIVVGHMMGAYTIATATEFNLFPKPRIVVIGRVEGAASAGGYVSGGVAS